MDNIFDHIPGEIPEEIFENLLVTNTVRIERILSKGHCSPESGWYDQVENEWVLVLRGQGKILFEDGKTVALSPGDFINIQKHVKHRVLWTSPNEVTLWLAIFYS